MRPANALLKWASILAKVLLHVAVVLGAATAGLFGVLALFCGAELFGLFIVGLVVAGEIGLYRCKTPWKKWAIAAMLLLLGLFAYAALSGGRNRRHRAVDEFKMRSEEKSAANRHEKVPDCEWNGGWRTWRT